MMTPTASKLPRWRGFNLLEKFTEHMNTTYQEEDFEFIAHWGFNFVRLPMSYRCWAPGNPAHWLEIDERGIEDIDAAIALGKQYGIHVNLNLHRAPGYCVNPPAEELDLWTDEAALEATATHWGMFAKRYKGISNEEVTFDLLNEPADIEEAVYVNFVEHVVAAIREQDPDRLIIVDGLMWGNKPVHGIAKLGVAQSTRGYAPMQISHHMAGWVHGSDTWDTPTWPLDLGNGDIWDRERLYQERIVPWKELESKGVGIHVGEWGAFVHTPHDVALRWMKDSLELWQELAGAGRCGTCAVVSAYSIQTAKMSYMMNIKDIAWIGRCWNCYVSIDGFDLEITEA